MTGEGEFTVRALADNALGRDVISIKQWDSAVSLNLRVSIDAAEELAKKILRAVTYARYNELDPK